MLPNTLSFFNLHIINIQIQNVLKYLVCVLPRMLWPTRYGRRHHLQPTDHRLFHPPCSLWSAEVVPLLRPPEQKGTGERLDGCRKWQMALDPGNRCTEWHWSWANLSSLNENEWLGRAFIKRFELRVRVKRRLIVNSKRHIVAYLKKMPLKC